MTNRAFASKLVSIAREENRAVLFALQKERPDAASTARRFRDAHMCYARQFAQ